MARESSSRDLILDRHWRLAAAASTATLVERLNLGEAQIELLPRKDGNKVWEKYVRRLREGGDLRLAWPSVERYRLEEWMTLLTDELQSHSVMWFSNPQQDVVIVAKLPLSRLPGQGLLGFVSYDSDLMLATSDLKSGLCVQVVFLGKREEYELVAWGEFSRSG